MFNRSYHLRAVKQAGGGQKVAQAVLSPTEGGKFYRPAAPVPPQPPATRRKQRSRRAAHEGPGEEIDRQFKLAFALTEDELAAEFERMFPL
jgi:hypothetical protein